MMICFIHMFELLNSFYLSLKMKNTQCKTIYRYYSCSFQLFQNGSTQLIVEIVFYAETEHRKQNVFLNIFSRGKPVFLAIKILVQVSEEISRHFVLQVGFSKEQNKNAFEDRFNKL